VQISTIGNGNWGVGLNCADGGTSICTYVGASTASGPSDSQRIVFGRRDAGGGYHQDNLWSRNDGYLVWNAAGINTPNMPNGTTGGGPQYVCIDSTGSFYKNPTCGAGGGGGGGVGNTISLLNVAPLPTVDLNTTVPTNGFYASGSGAVFQTCPVVNGRTQCPPRSCTHPYAGAREPTWSSYAAGGNAQERSGSGRRQCGRKVSGRSDSEWPYPARSTRLLVAPGHVRELAVEGPRRSGVLV
jgi:hypothetical protein